MDFGLGSFIEGLAFIILYLASALVFTLAGLAVYFFFDHTTFYHELMVFFALFMGFLYLHCRLKASLK